MHALCSFASVKHYATTETLTATRELHLHDNAFGARYMPCLDVSVACVYQLYDRVTLEKRLFLISFSAFIDRGTRVFEQMCDYLI